MGLTKRGHDEQEEERSIALLRGALNETNRAVFDAMPIEEQRWVIDGAFRDGVLRYGAVAPHLPAPPRMR